MCLLIAAHNEEVILDATLKSAMSAGICKHHIFVVDDNSSDETYGVATKRLGAANVLKVERSGKALALHKAINHFKIIKNYSWMHVADADSVFSRNYFRIIRRDLDPEKFCAAIGVVQSMRGNWISSYRTCLYAFGQVVNRRIESFLRVIPVMPGPTSIYKTEILPELNFFAKSVTEDFDMTLQIYRKKLGRIQYIKTAINYTQDPKTLRGYYKQVSRWSKGYFQSIINHRIGLKPSPIDAYLAYQILKTLVFALEMAILLPLRVTILGSGQILLLLVASDMLMMFFFALFGAVYSKRWSILLHFPLFFVLRFVDIFVFVKSMAGVAIKRLLRIERHLGTGWTVADKRYQLSLDTLAEVGQQ
ncbi:MAG: glycosyltransferase family 2 protein [Candidatus Saccharibacteria bacterium]|nr:glycosyltransferase family 2 protein [Candidatus Saccharibacteria bacterium]